MFKREELPKLDDKQKFTPSAKNKRSKLVFTGPRELSDQTVYELALCGNTMEHIAFLFGVSLEALIKLHQPAFESGKIDMKVRPRRGIFNILARLEDEVENNLNNIGEAEVKSVKGEFIDGIVQIDHELLSSYHKYCQLAEQYLPKEAITIPKEELPEEALNDKIRQLLKTTER